MALHFIESRVDTAGLPEAKIDRQAGFSIQRQAGVQTLTMVDFAKPGGMFTTRLRLLNRPSRSACTWAHTASIVQLHTRGVAGSMIGQAACTNCARLIPRAACCAGVSEAAGATASRSARVKSRSAAGLLPIRFTTWPART